MRPDSEPSAAESGRLARALAEAAEQISGFNIIECDDLDQALEVAAQHPILSFGTIEVSPFAAG